MKDKTDTRRLVRLDTPQAQQIDALRKKALAVTGVQVTFAAMVRAAIEEGVKVLAAKGKA